MFVLVHSPLVGPLSWQRVVEELARRGMEATVPEVSDHPSSTAPYWEQHARSVVRSLRTIPEDEPLVLAGHSGAGPLLPAVVAALGRSVQAYLFVDAGLPEDGASRLDGMRREAPEWAAELEEHLGSGGRFPEWTEDDLRGVIPVDGLREGIVAEIRPRPLAFFSEPIPVFGGWPDAPCGYVRLSEAYDVPLEDARARGWRTRSIEGGHFDTVVEPEAVTDAMLSVMDET